MAVVALGCHPTHTNDTHMASLPNLFQYPQLRPQSHGVSTASQDPRCQCFHCLSGSTAVSTMTVFPWSPRIHSCHPWGHNVSMAYSSLAQGLLFHTVILFTYNPHLLYFEQFKTFFVHGLRFSMCSILPKTKEVPRNCSEGRTKECHFCPLSLTAWVECSAHNGHLKGTSWVKKMEK